MFYKGKHDRERQLRFSIRKVSFGAASIAVAAFFMFVGNGAVAAAETPSTSVPTPDTSKQIEEEKEQINNQTDETRGGTSLQVVDEQDTESGTIGKHGKTTDTPSVSNIKGKSEETLLHRRNRRALPQEAQDMENPTYTAPSDSASADDLATKLKELPSTVDNEKKLPAIDEVGATQNINKGEVKELNEFGGWNAVIADNQKGKFTVARKTADGVFPIETVNTVKGKNLIDNVTWTQESVFNRDNEYVLLLSKVRTEKNRQEETFDGKPYQENGEGKTIAKGLKGFNGIEKTFKTFSSSVGSSTTIRFKTGYTGDIDGFKAKYKVEVFGKKMGSTTPDVLYTATFDPSKDVADDNMTVVAAKDGNTGTFSTKRGATNRDELNKKLAETKNKPNGTAGTFTSKVIDIPAGYTEYTVRISAGDNDRLGMGYQINWDHYALPITGSGFSITQDTKKVAKDLLTKVYTKLTEQKPNDTKWSTAETKMEYEEKLQAITVGLNSEASTTENYKKLAEAVVEKHKTLNEETKIKDKAKAIVESALSDKEKALDANAKLSEAEKTAAKAEAKKAADQAKEAIDKASDQAEVDTKATEGKTKIEAINPVGKDKAKAIVESALSDKVKALDANAKLSEAEKTAAKAEAKKAADQAKEAIDKASDQAEVDAKATEGKTKIEAINPVGKDKAKAIVEAALSDKEKALPSTGTADSSTLMIAAAASAVLGLAFVGYRRKEDDI